MIVLHVAQGADRGVNFELPSHEPQLIGRSSESLPITDTTVSRRHAELTPDDGTWYLRDLASANGTFVNGQRITERVELSPGDQIKCGSTLFIFTLRDEGTPKPSVVRLVDELEVTVEASVDPNADSMILASPDPAKAARDHLRVIYDLTSLTASTFNRDELLQRVMDLVFDEFDPDRGFVLLGSDANAPLDAPVTRYRERPKSTDEGRIPVSRTIVRHALEHREGVLSTNAMSDDRFRSGDSVRDYGIRSALCVPIVAGERVFGAMHIDSQRANFTFTESQLLLMTAIGRHAGLALLSAEHVESRLHTERLAAMGQTIASLSHSIRNIIQGLRGGADAVELALNRGDLELAKNGWPILARNLNRILTLTLNMLAYSRETSLDVELSDLNRLVEEVTELLGHECDRRGIGVIHELAEDMPPVPMDVAGIHQALVNIIMNAAEAAPPKRGVVTIVTRFDAAAHRAIVRIADNGPGIDPSRRATIFEAFRSTKGARGTGLGLAVTKKIVEEHGGTVEVESTPNAGTTVILALPSDQTALDAGDTRSPRPIVGDHLS